MNTFFTEFNEAARTLNQARKMPPTQKHHPIIKFGILGTVYGISPEGEVVYFDYDWNAALAFAGVPAKPNWKDLDLRLSKPKSAWFLSGWTKWHPELSISTYEKAYWIKENAS